MTPATQPASAIVTALDHLPPHLLARSGSVFYSGPSAFSRPAPLYILGLNPGGSPTAQAAETVAVDITEWHALDRPWSAYSDESWQGRTPGTHGMQPRMLHFFNRLRLDPRSVPSANAVFVRSSNEAALASEKGALMRACWPVHSAVIGALQVRTLLCLGGTAGAWVREQLGANQEIARFTENNARGWSSVAHTAPDGRAVITVTHPSRVNWGNPATDPSPLVRKVLGR